jgi:hypothetical protein
MSVVVLFSVQAWSRLDCGGESHVNASGPWRVGGVDEGTVGREVTARGWFTPYGLFALR